MNRFDTMQHLFILILYSLLCWASEAAPRNVIFRGGGNNVVASDLLVNRVDSFFKVYLPYIHEDIVFKKESVEKPLSIQNDDINIYLIKNPQDTCNGRKACFEEWGDFYIGILHRENPLDFILVLNSPETEKFPSDETLGILGVKVSRLFGGLRMKPIKKTQIIQIYKKKTETKEYESSGLLRCREDIRALMHSVGFLEGC